MLPAIPFVRAVGGGGSGSGIGGSTGATDNQVLRSNGTGGSTAQASGATLDDSATLTVNGLLCYPGGNQSADEKVQLAGGAGGTLFSSDSDITWYDDPDISSGSPTASLKVGSGSPEGVVSARVGSIYLRTNGGAGTCLYVKESGTGNTGWSPK